MLDRAAGYCDIEVKNHVEHIAVELYSPPGIALLDYKADKGLDLRGGDVLHGAAGEKFLRPAERSGIYTMRVRRDLLGVVGIPLVSNVTEVVSSLLLCCPCSHLALDLGLRFPVKIHFYLINNS